MSVSTTDIARRRPGIDSIDFSLGSVIALVAYFVWPTSLHTSVSDAMANLYQALERYLTAVFDIVEHKGVAPESIVARSRTTRMAWIRAESAVGRAVAEPGFARAGPSDVRGQLATTMRILRALHAIRIEAERGATVEPSSEFDQLIRGCADALRTLYEEDQDHVEVADRIFARSCGAQKRSCEVLRRPEF